MLHYIKNKPKNIRSFIKMVLLFNIVLPFCGLSQNCYNGCVFITPYNEKLTLFLGISEKGHFSIAEPWKSRGIDVFIAGEVYLDGNYLILKNYIAFDKKYFVKILSNDILMNLNLPGFPPGVKFYCNFKRECNGNIEYSGEEIKHGKREGKWSLYKNNIEYRVFYKNGKIIDTLEVTPDPFNIEKIKQKMIEKNKITKTK